MKKSNAGWIAAVALVLCAAPAPVLAQGKDQAACEDACYAAEERCYAACEESADPSACEDACAGQSESCYAGCE